MSNENISSFTSHSEQETFDLALDFAGRLKGNEKICLIGPLGSGKTTFVRGMALALGISKEDVASPTFTLVREYGSKPKIYHVDLYRLDKEEEIIEAGIAEIIASDNLVIIEWADKLEKFQPENAITIHFAHSGLSTRTITIT